MLTSVATRSPVKTAPAPVAAIASWEDGAAAAPLCRDTKAAAALASTAAATTGATTGARRLMTGVLGLA